MRLVDAVYKRIIELSNKKNLSLYQVAKDGCVPYSTIATMTRSKTVTLSTIYSVCDGLQISLSEFFSAPYFNKEFITD